MSKVLVDDHDIEAIRFGRKIGVNGKEGTCYFSEEDNQVVKIYHMYLPNRKVYFENLNNNNVAFPNDILLDTNTGLIAGYTMNYLQGVKIMDGFSEELEIKLLKKAYIFLKEILKKYNDICMEDLVLENILFDYQKKVFNIIDTSRWYPCFDSFERNLQFVDGALSYALCNNHLGWLNKKNITNKELLRIYEIYQNYNPTPFLELLELVEEEVKQKTGIRPEKIENLTLKIPKRV